MGTQSILSTNMTKPDFEASPKEIIKTGKTWSKLNMEDRVLIHDLPSSRSGKSPSNGKEGTLVRYDDGKSQRTSGFAGWLVRVGGKEKIIKEQYLTLVRTKTEQEVFASEQERQRIADMNARYARNEARQAKRNANTATMPKPQPVAAPQSGGTPPPQPKGPRVDERRLGSLEATDDLSVVQ